MKHVLGLFALACAGCAFKPAKIFADYTRLEVREVARSLHCNAPDAEARAQLFDGVSALRGWLDTRAVSLPAAAALADLPYGVVEMGQQPTGGYGVAVSRAAVLRGELLILTATFIRPAPDAMVTQAVTSPCVVVQLPPGRYRAIEVQDQAGTVRATGRAFAAGPQA